MLPEVAARVNNFLDVSRNLFSGRKVLTATRDAAYDFMQLGKCRPWAGSERSRHDGRFCSLKFGEEEFRPGWAGDGNAARRWSALRRDRDR